MPAKSTSAVSGSWTGDSGGYKSPHNPQVRLEVTARATVTLMLQRTSSTACALAFFVYKHDRHFICAPELSCALVDSSPYIRSDRAELAVTLSAGIYIVLLTQETAGAIAKFDLSSTTGILTVLEPTGCHLKHSLRGTGGYENPRNPQFFLTMSKPSLVTITLSVSKVCDYQAIRFYVVNAVHDECDIRQFEFGTEASRVLTSTFLQSDNVSAHACFEKGSYVVLPMLKTDIAECTFTLNVRTECDPHARLAGKVSDTKEIPSCDFAEMLTGKRVTGVLQQAISIPFLIEPDNAKTIVDAITANCRRTSRVFFDSDFKKTEDKSITWLRPRSFIDKPVLFSATIGPEDIQQGQLGNCWLCATVASLATRPMIVNTLFYPNTYNECGIYSVRFFVQGEWRCLLIDDMLPTKQNKLVYAHGSSLWFPLLEKAVAKLLGSYANVDASSAVMVGVPSTQMVMELFTAGVARYLTTDDGKWFTTLLEHLYQGWLATCSVRGADEKVRSDGLVGHHAYTVLNVIEQSGVRLVKLRNTWGRQEWNGEWSRRDPKWASNPRLAAICEAMPSSSASAEDGCFWMSATDFALHYRDLHVCRITSDEMHYHVTCAGEWAEGSHGYRNSALSCQVLVKAPPPPCVLRIRLIRMDINRTGAVLFRLYASTPGRTLPSVHLSDTPVVFESPYLQAESVTGDVQIRDGGRCFILVPTISEVVEGARFQLQMQCSGVLSADILPRPFVSSTSGPWAVGGGGHRGQNSPRVVLSVPEATEVSLTLHVLESGPEQGIEFRVAHYTEALARSGWPSDKETVLSSRYLRCNNVSVSAPLAPATYILFITKQNNLEARFKLECFSTACRCEFADVSRTPPPSGVVTPPPRSPMVRKTTPPPASDPHVMTLVAMGFPTEVAEGALRETFGDVRRAVELLLQRA